MKILIFNSSHVVEGSNNSKYRIRLAGANLSEDSKIALHSLMVPYSWFNISSTYNNNYFSYSINGEVYPVNLGNNAFLSIDDINAILHIDMYTRGFYLLDALNNEWYPIDLSINSSRYGVQADIKAFPPTLPLNYTNPANVFYNTVIVTSTALIIPESGIKEIFGFNAGTYLNTSQTTVLSTFTPNATPVNTIIMRCSACSNDFSIPSDMLYSFSPSGVAFGQNIVERASALAWCDARQGSLADITIEFQDQNFRPIQMNDKNVCITLLIKEKGE